MLSRCHVSAHMTERIIEYWRKVRMLYKKYGQEYKS